MDQIARLLKQHAFFAPLSARALKALAQSAEVIRMGEGAKLYTQGAPADSAFLILNGSVDLVAETDGRQEPVQFLGAGAVLSHLALITQSSRLTSAYAHTSLEVAKLNRTDFNRILRDEPEAAIGIRAHLLSILNLSKREREELIQELERGI